MVELTRKQYLWLTCHGDRDDDDVLEDEKGRYVLMFSYFEGDVKVYIPADKRLRIKSSFNGYQQFVELI